MTSPEASRSSIASSILPRVTSPDRVAGIRPNSEFGFNFRRSNASLASLLNANSGKRSSTPIVTSSPLSILTQDDDATAGGRSPEDVAYKDTIVRSFVPHIALLPSSDTEELLAQKGFLGGLLELLRPFGEKISGKVTIRDSTGLSKSFEDYGVRFVRLKDGLDAPRLPDRDSKEIKSRNIEGYMDRLLPHSSARLRTGGDIDYVEELVGKHLYYADAPPPNGPTKEEEQALEEEHTLSPFHLLYLRRLLSGHPMSPHESFAHPVACVIAISSRNPDPIEELRNLYSSTISGENKLPEWAGHEYLRYYVLIHDEEHDDIQRSSALFEQMKRHFGLHCHLLRIRSTQCVPSDDDSVRLPVCEWLSPAEELSEIQKRETLDDMDDTGPCLYESDTVAIRAMIRELVTQSVVPMMERQSATWNDQIVSRRRGISGRFLSLSKKWTNFGSGNRSSGNPFSSGSSNSNYDSSRGFYRPDTPEALMRRLADYCVMLRDFKLAYTVYDILRSDYQNDKAWKYYAGACEMTAITSLLANVAAKGRESALDTLLDAASYSYITRSESPFYALRLQAMAVELLHLRGAASADEAAKWACHIIEGGLAGPIGTVLFAERVARCYSLRKGSGSGSWGSRRRKAALWSVLSAQRWIDLGQRSRAASCLADAWRLYKATPMDSDSVAFDGMRDHLQLLTRQSAEEIVEDLLVTRVEESEDSFADEKADRVDESIENMGSITLPTTGGTLHKRSGSAVSLKHKRSGSALTSRHQRAGSTLSAHGDTLDVKTPTTPGSASSKTTPTANDVSPTDEKEKVDIRRHRMSVIGMDTGAATTQPTQDGSQRTGAD